MKKKSAILTNNINKLLKRVNLYYVQSKHLSMPIVIVLPVPHKKNISPYQNLNACTAKTITKSSINARITKLLKPTIMQFLIASLFLLEKAYRIIKIQIRIEQFVASKNLFIMDRPVSIAQNILTQIQNSAELVKETLFIHQLITHALLLLSQSQIQMTEKNS